MQAEGFEELDLLGDLLNGGANDMGMRDDDFAKGFSGEATVVLEKEEGREDTFLGVSRQDVRVMTDNFSEVDGANTDGSEVRQAGLEGIEIVFEQATEVGDLEEGETKRREEMEFTLKVRDG